MESKKVVGPSYCDCVSCGLWRILYGQAVQEVSCVAVRMGGKSIHKVQTQEAAGLVRSVQVFVVLTGLPPADCD